MLAEREQAEPQMRATVDRVSELVEDGRATDWQAVGALRGEQLPNGRAARNADRQLQGPT
jgi:hypothetical protein